jgi:heme/copper-type cytochrome/quinol oxidase subunit 3
MVSVYLLRWYGILVALISSALFCLALGISPKNSIINAGINAVQAFLLMLAFIVSKINNFNDFRNFGNNRKTNLFEIVLFFIVASYVAASLIAKNT